MEKKDWKTWLGIAVLVLTAILQVVNGEKLDGVQKKVEKTVEKTEKLDKDVNDLTTKVAMSVNAK